MATVLALGLVLVAAAVLWKLLLPWKVRTRSNIRRLGNGFSVMDFGISAEKAGLAELPQAEPRAYEIALYFTFKRRPRAGV